MVASFQAFEGSFILQFDGRMQPRDTSAVIEFHFLERSARTLV